MGLFAFLSGKTKISDEEKRDLFSTTLYSNSQYIERNIEKVISQFEKMKKENDNIKILENKQKFSYAVSIIKYCKDTKDALNKINSFWNRRSNIFKFDYQENRKDLIDIIENLKMKKNILQQYYLEPGLLLDLNKSYDRRLKDNNVGPEIYKIFHDVDSLIEKLYKIIETNYLR